MSSLHLVGGESEGVEGWLLDVHCWVAVVNGLGGEGHLVERSRIGRLRVENWLLSLETDFSFGSLGFNGGGKERCKNALAGM